MALPSQHFSQAQRHPTRLDITHSSVRCQQPRMHSLKHITLGDTCLPQDGRGMLGQQSREVFAHVVARRDLRARGRRLRPARLDEQGGKGSWYEKLAFLGHGGIVALPAGLSPMLPAAEPLNPEHDSAGFDCGLVSLNTWRQRRAPANQVSGASPLSSAEERRP